jgi:hypothetical protein
MNLEKIIKEVLNEVRYLDTDYFKLSKENPIKNTETIRVFHGFSGNSSGEIFKILKYGLSGKERASRIYSYEYNNNPYGLFVSTNINMIKKNFAGSGFIIEFTAKVSDLEAPVWPGGRGHFVQGEYTLDFKDSDDREQQRLKNRERASSSQHNAISKSDRPELADTLLNNSENQALFVGDLNPNMIKAVWYNEKLHKEHRINGEWIRMSRKDFINKLKIDTKREYNHKFYPNDDFTIEKFKSYLDNDDRTLIAYLDEIINYDLDNDYALKQYGLWPKQIKQIRDLNSKGFFDKYIK